MTDYAATLSALYPNAEWTLNGDGFDLTWLSEGDAPTRAELDAAWPRVQAELANPRAAADRAAAYNTEADPLFFYWQSGEGAQEAWLEKRAEIRERFPYVEVPE
jgi:hypothetical protein